MEIKLSAEQEALFDVMEKTRQHLFITGRAGAGKSVLLRHFRENTRKKTVVAAPTGIAALNVRGQTLHSLFKLPPQLVQKGSLSPNSRLNTLLKRIDCLVIDEVSMARADIIDAVDERLREACNNDTPFGGVQLIMFGDVYQLPPVVEKDLVQYFEAVHNGYFFFNALAWQQAEFKIYELTQVFRQKDPVFRDVLNAVRDGSVTEVQIEQLNTRYGASLASDEAVTLAPTNSLVTEINQRRLDQLEGKARKYVATITGEMKKSVFPTEENLQLKKGAQVVLLKNDKDGRWVNGSVGKVEALFDDHITVRVGGVVYSLERETWEEVNYAYDMETKKIEMKVGSSFTQYPLRLAWAMTIHKSQGQTYEHVLLDLTTATFAPGQCYVALSRCVSLEGLSLKVPVRRKDIIVDSKVMAFMAKRETMKLEVEEIAPDVVPECVQSVPVVTDIHPDEIPARVPVALAPVSRQLHHDEIQVVTLNPQQALPLSPQLDHDGNGVAVLAEGKVSRIAAIEILCPSCSSPCTDPATQSQMITTHLVGHMVVCSQCEKTCIVPLNAFSLQGEIIARELMKGVTNAKREKVGRTKKEKKSTKGRKAKSGVVREPCQLSLDVRTIGALNLMGVNKSALYEDLLQQYDPFLEALAAIGDSDELHHDEIEEE